MCWISKQTALCTAGKSEFQIFSSPFIWTCHWCLYCWHGIVAVVFGLLNGLEFSNLLISELLVIDFCLTTADIRRLCTLCWQCVVLLLLSQYNQSIGSCRGTSSFHQELKTKLRNTSTSILPDRSLSEYTCGMVLIGWDVAIIQHVDWANRSGELMRIVCTKIYPQNCIAELYRSSESSAKSIHFQH